MKARFLISVMSCLVIGTAAAASAQQADSGPKTQEKASATTKTQPVERAQLQAQIHRTMADLMEARSADQPDADRIKALTEKLQLLRAKFRSDVVAPVWNCPWGGPGMGPAYGRGPGYGYGRGPGYGYGRGPGYGYGRGPGYGYGRGPGYGYGRGPGYGRGWGGGPGWGGGYGRGPGWGYQDSNQNGMCDHFERMWGQP